jgi:UTP--glucose-1-phosphate uridylyltransferase
MVITKAIIPAAGLGTRFLPATKAVAKEMLPILDKPAIQYIVEEAVASGIAHFTMIFNKNKTALINHFENAPDLDIVLKERGKEKLLLGINKLIRNTEFTYVSQSEPLGLGHAILLARNTIGKEYFGILLPDDIIVGNQPGLAQLIAVAKQEGASVIAVQEVPIEQTASYGIIAIKKQISPVLYQINGLVEKPKSSLAPSNLAIVGRYVLSHKIFASLDAIMPYTQGELQLTDGIAHMVKNGEKVFAYKIQGHRYDTGNPLGLLKANIGIGLQHPEYGPHLQKLFEKKLIDVIAGHL